MVGQNRGSHSQSITLTLEVSTHYYYTTEGIHQSLIPHISCTCKSILWYTLKPVYKPNVHWTNFCVRNRQVKETKISYIETYLKFGLIKVWFTVYQVLEFLSFHNISYNLVHVHVGNYTKTEYMIICYISLTKQFK